MKLICKRQFLPASVLTGVVTSGSASIFLRVGRRHCECSSCCYIYCLPAHDARLHSESSQHEDMEHDSVHKQEMNDLKEISHADDVVTVADDVQSQSSCAHRSADQTSVVVRHTYRL